MVFGMGGGGGGGRGGGQGNQDKGKNKRVASKSVSPPEQSQRRQNTGGSSSNNQQPDPRMALSAMMNSLPPTRQGTGAPSSSAAVGFPPASRQGAGASSASEPAPSLGPRTNTGGSTGSAIYKRRVEVTVQGLREKLGPARKDENVWYCCLCLAMRRENPPLG